ncbi:MAG: hypothetical protein ABEH65_09270 [Halobacteriales archaeon]
MNHDNDQLELTERERTAIHELELGVEWLERAHGNLLAFHHATGHAMDHLREAETRLRACGHDSLADRLRDEFLPRGVIDDDRWSYDVLETFESLILSDVRDLRTDALGDLTDGTRHVAERAQEQRWKKRARDGDRSSR